jgi:uncharacterized protein GlcG (DUF336 family)
MKRISLKYTGFAFGCLLVAACSGGGGVDTAPPPPPPPPQGPTRVYADPATVFLSAADVGNVMARAIEEASAQGLPSVITVVDRVGNVLAVFTMNGAPATTKTRPGPGGNFDAQGIDVPTPMAAISKALSGAYLSSAGNAFSSRTASMIVQQHFPPAPTTIGLESGPLFGVQFSQLPCSDLNTRFVAGGPMIGPNRAPLGLSADPGGLPLYKNGTLVGAIGVAGDNDYGFDTDVLDIDDDAEEMIALAGATAFDAPENIRANKISVDGTTLRFRDKEADALLTDPQAARSFATLDGTAGALTAVRGYYGDGVPVVLDGAAYGTEAAGIRRVATTDFSNPDAYILTDGAGNNRFPVRAATDAADVATPLSQLEVRTILEEAFKIASRSRGQIRRPLDSRSQVSISIVDTHGQILGIVRTPDAPIFGTDVSLQKARTATFFSGANAGGDLGAANQNPALAGGGGVPDPDVRKYVGDVRTFLGDPNALTGTHAFADRSGGNLSRPYFPDGEVGTPNGPLGRTITEFSPLATGLQSALVVQNIAEHIGFVAAGAGGPADTPARCSFIPDVPGTTVNRLQNGIQIFPGSVPIYRGNRLVGGIGVSGDGIDQDDMISFLGLHNAGVNLGTIGNADPAIRADNIVVNVNGEDIRLRFISCPFNPFIDSDEQNVCQGL